MSSNNIIVREYLSSLKEDKELDYLFPILLQEMGYRIVQTAKESKGQSQYGKDIIAIGKDSSEKEFKWYFELKGHSDKDITDGNYSKKDGIRESIIESRDTAFNDSSIKGFNKLPIKIVLVHNGVLKANVRHTFEGLIVREFKEGEFERWDIYYLTELFAKYLFNEYLLTDDESNRLFKRTLAFLDAPDNDFSDFKQLVELQFEKINNLSSDRFQKKFFATLNLLLSIIFHYSQENNNLLAAKECVKFVVLRTWAWILKGNLETKEPILKEFRKLLVIQHSILEEYFKKTFPVASIENGLYSENGHFFEAIGYPLRCFEYLDDLIYYNQLELFLPEFSLVVKDSKRIRNKQKDSIIKLVNNNSGCLRPILDNHSIPILHLFLFFADKSDLRKKDVNFIAPYILDLISSIIIIKNKRGRLPELYNRIDLVSEFSYSKTRPEEYCDDASMLLATLLELLVLFDARGMYNSLREHLDNKVDLQIPHPNIEEFEIEQRIFEGHMDEEYYIESLPPLPDDFNEFKKSVKVKEIQAFNYRTDLAGFPFLRTLAHSYFKNEIFPSEWRKHIVES